MKLPILDFLDTIVKIVCSNQVTIVVGETGSGKTTVLPQILYHMELAEHGVIGITEPRRIAATSTAAFVADELGVPLGGLVGYQVRFDDVSAAGTAIKFMTDGILLREFQIDPDLKKYSAIMIDEAHERSQNIDFALGLLKDLLKRRSDLKVVVASATIDEQKFSRYFSGAPIVNVTGRMFPVETIWSDNDFDEEEMVDAVVEKIVQIHKSGKPGDILVFMTGESDIRAVINGIDKLNLSNLIAIPVYAALSHEEQQRIFADFPGKRKAVVATNIAETSITIDGIVYVVDSGLIKQTHFHPESGIQSLDVVEHSQAGCRQRAGRAGRTQKGVCYRMYIEENFQNRRKFTEPEIRRTSLASVVLAMEDIGIKNIREFDFVDPPEKEAFTEAYETLIALGAISKDKRGLTELGKEMARLPLEPRISRMVLEAQKYGCVKEIATIAAFLSVRNIFNRPKEWQEEADLAHAAFKDSGSDALTFLNIWKEYEAVGFDDSWCRRNFLSGKSLAEVAKIRTQLFRILAQSGIELSESGNKDDVAKAVCCGLVYNIIEHSLRYYYNGLFRPIEVLIHPSSTLFKSGGARWMVAAEIVRTTKVFARTCTKVKPEWLPQILPNLFKYGSPTVECHFPGDPFVTIKKPVFCLEILHLGTEVGAVLEKVSAEEAAKIQRARIREAEAAGLVPLKFMKVPNHYGNHWLAQSGGRYYKTFSMVQEGTTYYCRIGGSLLGESYAEKVFEVFDSLFDKENDSEKKSLPPKDAVDLLVERWGARRKKHK
jgi:RNA helicase HrpA